jgi:hypothetical protein
MIDGNDDDDIDDWELMPVYRRRQEFTALVDEIDDMELSPEIDFRLMLIREKVLKKYRESMHCA